VEKQEIDNATNKKIIIDDELCPIGGMTNLRIFSMGTLLGVGGCVSLVWKKTMMISLHPRTLLEAWGGKRKYCEYGGA